MTHAPSSAAVPFPPIPAGRPPGLDSARLLLRPFGTEVEDLELDFSGTPRPFLETEILRRCSHFAEGSRPADDLFWDLEIGKRVESLLILSSLEDGRPYAVEDRCRATGCGERMEVELTLEELVEAQRQSEREARVEARRGDEARCFRRPTGRDQIAFRQCRPANEAETARLIATALLIPDSAQIPESADWISAIEDALEDADPLVHLNLRVNCPQCGSPFLFSVDPGRLALARLQQAQRRLVRDVHRLASAYHWSEAEIFAVPASRRREYLAELDREER